MVTQEHIENLSNVLQGILKSELELGNKIVETSEGWPEERTIIIFLEKPFMREYQIAGVEFRPIDDPHYWKSEYYDSASKHVLACKYG